MAKFAASAAILAAPAAAIKSFADFQQGIINAVAVTGLFGREADEARKRLMELGLEMSQRSLFSAKETAGAFYELASAGVAVREMSMQTVQPILDLAQATGGNLQDATHLAIATLNQFRTQFKEGMTGANMTEISDAFTATVNVTFATLDRLGDSMQYIGPVAAAMGQSLQQTLAQLGGLYNAGFEASLAGTSLRNALDEIAAPSGEAQDALAKLGVTTLEMTPHLLDLKSTVDAARTALQGNEATVEALDDQMRTLGVTIKQNEGALERHKQRFDREKDSIDKTKQSMTNLKAEFDKLTKTRLPGMEAFDNQLFALEQQRKQLELQKTQLAPFQLFEKNQVDAQLAVLQQQIEQVTLKRDIQFDPQTKAIEDAANAARIKMGEANAPMVSNDIIAQIGAITGQYAQQSATLDRVTSRHDKHAKVIAHEERDLSALKTTLGDLRDRYNDAKDAQEDLKKALESAEQVFSDAPKKGRELLGVLDELRAKGATAADFIAIFGKRGGPAMLALSGMTDKVRVLQQQIESMGGVAARTASEQMRGLTGEMHLVGAAFNAAGISIVDQFQPQLTGIARGITGFVHEHGPQLQHFLVDASTWFSTFASNALNSQSGLWPEVRKIVQNGWANVRGVWTAAQALLSGDGETFRRNISGIVSRLGGNIGAVKNIIGTSVRQIGQMIYNMLPPDWQRRWILAKFEIQKAFEQDGIIAAAQRGLSLLWQLLQPFFQRAWEVAEPYAVDLGTKIGSAIVQGMKQAIVNGVQAVGQGLSGTVDWNHVHQLDPRNLDFSRQGFLDAYSGLKMMVRGYASGGIVPGIGTGDTVPALLSPNEEILTPSDPRHRRNGGSGFVINFHAPVTIRSDNDIKKLSQELYREHRRVAAGMPA
jgi:TP901 family phage tail tape measure protein